MQIDPGQFTPVRYRGEPSKQATAESGESQVAKDSVEISSESREQRLDRFWSVITKHAAEKVAVDIAGLPAHTLMFHGTSVKFDATEARPNRRTSQGKVDWEGTAIFAAMDPRVALHYTADVGTGIGTGIDLRSRTEADEPITYFLDGGESQEDALNKTYGKPDDPESCTGFIHTLDKSKFVHEQGLGVMEMITRDESANIGPVTINRRAALDELVSQGAVVIHWSPS